MKRDELIELIGMLAKQLIDTTALNHYYATLVREAKQPVRNWSDLTEAERDFYIGAALKQAQSVFEQLGWGMEITDLRSMAEGAMPV